ncbi:efflux RND transporter periplasmic adaptor subunit [Rhizobium sp. P44RR-XXIV]|uniref:efflux RND transporter periplasmic adaptor subunit n=1 Tax=Rhizobium sp. P44RR-XXIV TaxID=1921145 RepID=UPI0009CAB4B9|nr:efflux RND transporter periplasmic adaptor subunit [Rhizobium sp. P44RR-XXIV]TIX87490.1 efflux RND transporter periplasmic adaptor subunit [Rhizobium sp. P44RR-XXIV]
MNTSTEHDRKLAETLKSLSLEPLTATITSEPPRTIARRLALPAILVALATVPVATAVVWPNALGRIKAMLPDERRADIAASETPATNTRATKAGNVEAPSVREVAFAPTREITGSGYVVAPRSTAVFSKYEGRITGIPVEAGDHVEAGQVLVTLDDASARFALEQAMAARVSADLALSAKDIALAQADASLRRIGALASRQAASQKELEEAQTVWKSASNGVAQARQDLNRAELAIRIAQEQLDELTVRAPFAGTVTRLNAHVGDTMLARVDSVRENQSLLTLVDTGSMVIDADVAETNIAAIRPGMDGEAVLDGFPDRPFAIKLSRIAPVASSEKGTIALRFSLIAPPTGIRPNMAARIRIAVPNPQTSSGDVKQ